MLHFLPIKSLTYKKIALQKIILFFPETEVDFFTSEGSGRAPLIIGSLLGVERSLEPKLLKKQRASIWYFRLKPCYRSNYVNFSTPNGSQEIVSNTVNPWFWIAPNNKKSALLHPIQRKTMGHTKISCCLSKRPAVVRFIVCYTTNPPHVNTLCGMPRV